ncbi:hypothetical protein [Desulfospira joergensenii]|uniref:hypothetical protein n=1 Tax=Desulfospira joergensenii TaxID=53329 RepID=UPI0003B330F1|nr:hypothetical protein [Desulfospira joergensenii]
MQNSSTHPALNRVTDLIALKQQGEAVTCRTSFEIVPVNFAQGAAKFQAYVFLCHFSGKCGTKEYRFRKCYAKGCPDNLCPHVSQAVMIANRYLKRDYQRLALAGINLEESFFSLEEMLVKYDELDLGKDPVTGGMLTIHDYIHIAEEGNKVRVEVSLETIPAVEHFAHQKNEQSFLMADFSIITLGRKSRFQRCLSCFPTALEDREKPLAVHTANERLALLYEDFDRADIGYTRNFF